MATADSGAARPATSVSTARFWKPARRSLDPTPWLIWRCNSQAPNASKLTASVGKLSAAPHMVSPWYSIRSARTDTRHCSILFTRASQGVRGRPGGSGARFGHVFQGHFYRSQPAQWVLFLQECLFDAVGERKQLCQTHADPVGVFESVRFAARLTAIIPY